jgi:hypothetical protein
MEQRRTVLQHTSVAMLRSDVVYITPLDVRDHGEQQHRQHSAVINDNATVTQSFSSNVLTIPAFAQYPVSDRLAYGSPAAMKVWATERLSRLQAHVSYGHGHDPGTGIHSEQFLARTIFPLLVHVLNVTIRPHPTLCFVRARADESVWIDDCERPIKIVAPTIAQYMVGGSALAALEIALGRTCHGPSQSPIQGEGKVTVLNCSF